MRSQKKIDETSTSPEEIPLDMLNLDISSILKGLEAGHFSCIQLVAAYLARADEAKHLFSINQINSEALKLADDCDCLRRSGVALGGVPIVVKDVINTTDKLRSTAGSIALKDSTPKFEATIITRLQASGAILLGKTNLTDWASHRTKKSPMGFSPIGGQTYGVYHERQDPNGSSAGSGVAATLALAAASIGSETDGSILCPAQKSCVVGIKPTAGLVSRYGTFSASDDQDSIGPMARTVKDAAYLLRAIAWKDPSDSRSNGIPFERIPDYVANISERGFQNTRLAVPWQLLDDSEIDVINSSRTALETVRSLGATIIEDVQFKSWNTNSRRTHREQFKISFRVLFRQKMAEYLDSFEPETQKLRTLSDVIKLTKDTPDERPDFDVTEFEAAQAYPYDTDSKEFSDSLKLCRKFSEEMDEALDRYECDAFIVPLSADLPAHFGGHPQIIVPMGFSPEDTEIELTTGDLVEQGPGIPYGLVFVGRKYSEERLLQSAYAYEQKTQARQQKPPLFVPKIQLRYAAPPKFTAQI